MTYCNPCAGPRAGFFVAALMVLFGAVSADEAMASGTEFAALDSYIEQVRRDWQVPGIAVGLVKNGKVVFAKGYGEREIGKAPRVEQGSLFAIGSLTKAMTAAALGILVDEGRIEWNDPVIKHLPSFRVADPWLTRHITIRDLIGHRTGLEGAINVAIPMSGAQVVTYAAALESQVPFRDAVLYSNTMYDIAGEVVAAASGMSWAEFLERRLFGPLDMRDSSPSIDVADIWDKAHLAPTMYGQAPAGRAGIEDAPQANVTMPHWHTPQGVKALPWQVSLQGGAGAGSVVSNLEDLLKWLSFNLGDGRNARGHPLLQPGTLAELHSPQLIVRASQSSSHDVINSVAHAASPNGEPVAYAMGWFRQEYRGHRLLTHRGALLGGMSMMSMIPERGVGVIVLANSYGRGRDAGLMNAAISFRALDELLGLELHDWRGDFLRAFEEDEVRRRADEARMQQGRLRGTKPSLPLARYAGEYGNAQAGNVRIDLVDNGLALRRSGVFDWPLEHWHNDTFRLHVAANGVDLLQFFVTFRVDATGAVASFDPGWVLLGDEFVRSQGVAEGGTP